MYTAGSNDNGQLGTKITRSPSMQANGGAAAVPPDCSWKPLRVNALDLHKVQHASAGQSHVLAVTEQVWREGKSDARGYDDSDNLTRGLAQPGGGPVRKAMGRGASGGCLHLGPHSFSHSLLAGCGQAAAWTRRTLLGKW